jgi:hypothetical protein
MRHVPATAQGQEADKVRADPTEQKILCKVGIPGPSGVVEVHGQYSGHLGLYF